jgi:hypothetical protein
MSLHSLKIKVPDAEFYSEADNEFHYVKAQQLTLEHSLYTISKWEAIWHKCFLKHQEQLSQKEMFSYLKCMFVDPEEVSDDVIMYITNTPSIFNTIRAYINNTMTATFVRKRPGPNVDTEAKTAELMYYYLIKMRAPVDIFEHWHFNRLLALLTVFNAKDDTKHKTNIREMMIDNDKINEERKKRMNTKG